MVLREYLRTTRTFAFHDEIFAEDSPYNAWFASSYHQQYRAGFLEHAYRLQGLTSPPPVAKPLEGYSKIID